jgi:tRNA threonylcarbamoyl adenosine modification protein YeaZ
VRTAPPAPVGSLADVRTLALDTSTPAVTVAVVDGDARSSRVLAARSVVDARRHAELLAPMVDETLAAAGTSRQELRRVVVGVGPGPFTGLRIGVVTARALSDALAIPLVGVCSLDALAVAARDDGVEGPVLVVTDARRREVYWATYDAGRRTAGPQVGRPAEVVAELGWTGAVVGDGARLHPDAFTGTLPPGQPWLPQAADLVRALHAGAPALEPQPLYLRRPDAAVPGAPKQVLA